MNLWAGGIIGLIVCGCIGVAIFFARKAEREAMKLQEERDDAEAQRREWDIETRARNAVDHISNDAASVLSNPHNRDRKKPAV